MIAKNCGGRGSDAGCTDSRRCGDPAQAADAMHAMARDAMDRQAIKPYLDVVWTVVAEANRYFAGEEPWAKRKTDPERMETILYVTAEVVRQVAILAQPVTPAAAAKLLDLLAQDAEPAATFRRWARLAGWSPGTTLPPPRVFPALRRLPDAAEERGEAECP